MERFSRHYPDWKAPSADGQMIIWPPPDQILAQTLQNQQRLSDAESVRIQGIPLPQLRRRMRQLIGQPDDQPLLGTGHQTELYHPGVWAKNALISAAAARLQGRAVHLAVDTDAPKHLNLRWPPGESIPITDDPRITSAAWSGLLAPPTPQHLNYIASQFEHASRGWDFSPVLPRVLSSLRRLAMESLNLPAALCTATHELDWQLGLRHHVLLAGPVWSSDVFLVFVHDLLANADVAASHYNHALGAYRAEHGISSKMRPMPDLFVGPDAVEAPFWLDDLHSGRRSRPSVFRSDRGWVLELVGGEQFVFEKAVDGWEASGRLQRWLSMARHRISPRALTLTTFVRLMMVDQFVHGIGGGQYDQVTDRLIAWHYGLEPPHFSVTTATMYFPAALGRQRVCLPCVKQELHRLRHSVLGQRKRELVAQIEALPRRSRERAQKYYQMHSELAAAARASGALQRWQQRLLEAQQREKEERILFDRELFYALQPPERLQQMIQQYARQFDAPADAEAVMT
ncbi:hypothetical protein [Fontivita pretiosa]|uniref:hypothetical protein n=1 Tax=Fontivita pretiosa TaxID=2989684 RepID=UPI003D17BF9C